MPFVNDVGSSLKISIPDDSSKKFSLSFSTISVFITPATTLPKEKGKPGAIGDPWTTLTPPLIKLDRMKQSVTER